jgi:hypothetical protein
VWQPAPWLLVVAVCTRTVHTGAHNVGATEGACKIPPTDKGSHLRQRRREPPLKTAIMQSICAEDRAQGKPSSPPQRQWQLQLRQACASYKAGTSHLLHTQNSKTQPNSEQTMAQMWQRGSTHRQKLRSGGQARRYQKEYMQCA